MSLSLKFALFTSLLCLVVIGGITWLSYRISYGELESSLALRLEAVVRSGAVHIDGTAHDSVKTMDDVNTEAFLSIRDSLRELKTANGLNTEIYTFRRVGEKLEFVVMTNDKPYVGDTYSIRPEMLPTLNQGKPSHTGVYRDVHGGWISAYAPIFDQDGQISGLLEADLQVDTFLELLNQKFRVLVTKAVGFGIFAVIMSFLLARTVTRKLVYLTDITEKISLGKTDTPIEVQGSDEVAKLASSLERMRESLKIAAEMLQ